MMMIILCQIQHLSLAFGTKLAQVGSTACGGLLLFLPRNEKVSWECSYYSQKCLILSSFLMISCPQDHMKVIYTAVFCEV